MQMFTRFIAVSGCIASANGFAVVPQAPRHTAVACRSQTQPQMGMLTYKVAGAVGTAAIAGAVVATKKFLPKKEDPKVADFRSSLSGMDSLKGLSELSLEREEGKQGRVAGPWKEYIKNDGRKWYYNTESGKMQWQVPEEFVKLDEIAAAAAEANAARGT